MGCSDGVANPIRSLTAVGHRSEDWIIENDPAYPCVFAHKNNERRMLTICHIDPVGAPLRHFSPFETAAKRRYGRCPEIRWLRTRAEYKSTNRPQAFFVTTGIFRNDNRAALA
jgi:hypothetical protein